MLGDVAWCPLLLRAVVDMGGRMVNAVIEVENGVRALPSPPQWFVGNKAFRLRVVGVLLTRG